MDKTASIDELRVQIHGGHPSLRKRGLTFLAPCVVLSVLFVLKSYSPPELVIRWTFSDFNIAQNRSRNQSTDLPEECESRFNGWRLWTRNREPFEEPRCTAILEDDGDSDDELSRWSPSNSHDDRSIVELVSDCERFRSSIPFSKNPNSPEEAEYPIAYVITAESDAAQALRFLRNVYWPQNSYCFAPSPEASHNLSLALRSIASCFDGNVFTTMGNPESAALPDARKRFLFLRNIVDCLELMAATRRPGRPDWKYVQIVSAEDFPLKTNSQMIKILQLLNGSNDCGLFDGNRTEYMDCWDLNLATRVPPDGLILFSGTLHSTLTRDFVRFLLEHPTARSFLDWLNGASKPELYYWSTLMHNVLLNAPGGFPGSCLWFYALLKDRKRTISRASIWDGEPFDDRRKMCRDQNGFLDVKQKAECKLGIQDAAWHMQQPHLMAHRFAADHQPAAQYCLEKWHWRKMCERSAEEDELDWSFYAGLKATRYASQSDKNEFRC